MRERIDRFFLDSTAHLRDGTASRRLFRERIRGGLTPEAGQKRVFCACHKLDQARRGIRMFVDTVSETRISTRDEGNEEGRGGGIQRFSLSFLSLFYIPLTGL